jgi:AraC-like DNA-binding protein
MSRLGVPVSTVSMCFVRGLVEVVEQAGMPGEEFLRAACIEAEQLQAVEARLSRAELNRIFELAMDLLGDPALGLHCAEELRGGAFVPISELLTHAATLRRAFETLARFQRLLSDEPSFELVEHEDVATVRCLRAGAKSLRVQRFSAEMRLTNYLRLIRTFSLRARPERVSFEFAAPRYRREYSRVFEDTERFDQPFTGIAFDRALLDVPSPHKDEEVHEALRTIAERRIMRLAHRVPYGLRVRRLLEQRGAARRLDMQSVARSLGLSVRSLRRRLTAEGTSYHAVEDEALAVFAKHLLRDERRTIQETAYEMGFSDTSTFHRAFKRWTGTTPSAYRESS